MDMQKLIQYDFAIKILHEIDMQFADSTIGYRVEDREYIKGLRKSLLNMKEFVESEMRKDG